MAMAVSSFSLARGWARIRLVGAWEAVHLQEGDAKRPPQGAATAEGIAVLDVKQQAMQSVSLVFSGAYGMRELEIGVVEGHNSAAVDLFNPRHARRVLAAFGRAFGCLPENDAQQTSEQGAFLRLAVEGLAEDGAVISVRLAGSRWK